jgi:hypothetical protein
MPSADLQTLRARRIAAEDTHGRVFFSVCRLLAITPGGPDLVNGWLASYKQMERCRHDERQMIEHGKIITDAGPADPFPDTLDDVLAQ